jgi:hypothetical protein
LGTNRKLAALIEEEKRELWLVFGVEKIQLQVLASCWTRKDSGDWGKRAEAKRGWQQRIELHGVRIFRAG